MTRAFGLRAALTLLVLIAIAPVFAVVVQASLSEQEGRLQRAEADLRSVVELSAAHQERLVEGARQMLTAIANSPPVYEDDAKACADYMRKLQLTYPVAYGTFGLLDDQGRLTCRAEPAPNAVVANDRLFFRTAVQTKRFSVGEFIFSRASGRPILTFGLPVYRQEGGSLRGVVYFALDVAQADEQLRKLAIPPEMTLLVLDAKGVVLAAAGRNPQPVGSVPGGFLEQAIGQGAQRLEHAPGPDGGDRLFAVRPVGRPGEGKLFVAGMASSAEILAPSAERLYQQLAALILISLVGAAAAWAFGDRVVARPLARLLERVDALTREELPLDAPPPAMRLRELAQLDASFHAMARRLAERSVQRDGAMAEMAHQKTLLESVLASMAEGVLVIGGSGKFLHINVAALGILPGLAQLNREQKPLAVPPARLGIYSLDGETPTVLEHGPAAAALRGDSVDHFRYLVRAPLSPDGDKVVQGSAWPIRTPDARLAGAVVVFSDVTAPWRAEQELRNSEQRYRTLFESNPHPMWVFDTETLRFLTVNDAAVAHYGYSREEFLSMTIADIRPEQDRELLRHALGKMGQITAPAIWRHRVKDGRLIDVEVSGHSMEYAGRPGRIVLAFDVTRRLQAEAAMKQLNETLELRVSERTRELHMANKELESFSYSVSHDLRAPLQVIDGFGKALLARHACQLDDKARHYLDRIRENTAQMSALIDDLLSLARVTRAEIRTERFDLAAKARQTVERLRQRFPQREITVDIDEEMICEGDPRLMAVALENLIDNAWKFTERAQHARICVGCRTGAPGETIFFVNDNGAGFDMAYSDKLFNAFQRLHAVTEFEGTGIGLATVHRIVSRHGGRVWARASPGQGAAFEFSLQPGATHEETQQHHLAGGGQPGPPGAHPDDAGREQRPQRGGGHQ